MHEVPPSYYEALSNAVARLERNTPAARRAIFDRARQLLLEEAHNSDPPWHLMEIVREQRELEEAIGEIEAEYSETGAVRVPPREPPPPPAMEENQDVHPHREVRRPPAAQSPTIQPPRQRRIGVLPERPQHVREWDDAEMPEETLEYSPVPPSARAPGTSRTRQRRAPALIGSQRLVWVWVALAAVLILIAALGVWWVRSDTMPSAETSEPPLVEERAEEVDTAELIRQAIEQGNAHSRASNFDGAIAAYSEAIRHGHQSAALYNNRAFAYWSRGETDRAISDYDMALLLDPNNVVALTNRAVALNFRGDHERAVRDLDHALRLQPDDPDILNSRCWGRALAGDLQEALADCNESLRLRPSNPNTLDSRGFTHLKLGDHARAIADYDAALKLDPKQAASLYGRGIAKVRSGDEAGGRADMATAIAMRPEIEAIFERYGIK